MNRGAWQATVHGITRVRHDLATKPPPPSLRRLMPYPGLLHQSPWPCSRPLLTHSFTGDTQTQFWLNLWGVLVHTKFVWAFWASLVGKGLDSKCNFAPPKVLLRPLLCLWMWGILFLVGYNILQAMVVQQLVVALEFSHEKISPCPSTPTSLTVLVIKYQNTK